MLCTENQILSVMQTDNLLYVLKNCKAQSRYTNQSISDATGVPVDTVRKFFAGESKSPNVYNIMSFCILFGVSLDEILGNSIKTDNAKFAELEAENKELKIRYEYVERARLAYKAANTFRLRIIYSLLVICVLLTVATITLLTLDRQIPDYGLMQATTTHPVAVVIIAAVVSSLILIGFVLYRIIRRVREKLI